MEVETGESGTSWRLEARAGQGVQRLAPLTILLEVNQLATRRSVEHPDVDDPGLMIDLELEAFGVLDHCRLLGAIGGVAPL